MRHSTGKPTCSEQARLDALHAMPCMCCVVERIPQPSRTEAHHLVDKGYRKHSGGHSATLPLCGWHHEGRQVEGVKCLEMKVAYGPSLKLHKKEFIARYGTERKLLAKVDFQLMLAGVIKVEENHG